MIQGSWTKRPHDRVLGEDQVDQMLKGKEYNNDMRIHIYTAKAILRKKFQTFEEWLRNGSD